MIYDLHCAKIAVDGYGNFWPSDPGFWVPRALRCFENLGGGNRFDSVPWQVLKAYYTTSDMPHMIYHMIHGDDIDDKMISRSEIRTLIKKMKGTMRTAGYRMYIAPVRFPSLIFSRQAAQPWALIFL